jgi:hypothetical protein
MGEGGIKNGQKKSNVFYGRPPWADVEQALLPSLLVLLIIFVGDMKKII